MIQTTRFGSLRHYEKGGVEVINDDARNYVFSNVFEVASKAKPYEKVAVGKNIEYVIETIRVEGTSGWRAPAQDEFALVMDGEVEIRLLKLDNPGVVPAGTHGSIARRWARYGPSPAVRLIPCAFLGDPRGISCAHGIALFILFGTQPTTTDDTGGTT